MSHKIEMRLRKDKPQSEENDTSVGDRMYVIHETAKGVAKAAVAVMGAYFLFSTARYVAQNEHQDALLRRSDNRYEDRARRLEEK